MSADELKALGNKAFSAKDYNTAIKYFTEAIEKAPENHVLYSNRSACYASLHEYTQALQDAEKCTKINPTWAKGYNRVAAAEYGLMNYDNAEKAYKKCLELDPANSMAKDGLNEVTKARSGPANIFGQMFSDPNLINNLKQNPKTAEIMKDPAMVAKVELLRSNPGALNPQELMSDPRLMTVMTVLMGLPDMPEAPKAPKADSKPEPKAEPKSEPKAEPKPAPKSEPKAATKNEPEDVEMTDDSKAQADKYKAEANALYKKRKFDEAIELYNKAYETFEDVTYLNNRAAAEFEKGDYETAIKTCQEAVSKGRDIRADYRIIAKAFARIGTSYSKLGDLKQAIDYFNRSLTEHRTADVLTKLRTAEKALKQKEAEEYIDPEKAEQARLEGKEYFTKADWPNAVKAYTEMIKRAPHDARGYSNRAAAYVKLMSFPEAVKDCDLAIEKDEKFLRAYIRKATAQLAMKEYGGCQSTLEKAQEIDRKYNDGKSAYEINQLMSKAVSQRFERDPNETEEQARERISRDPEVVQILQDPVMQNILQQAQTNPAALQEHMKNPEVMKKIQILIAAGVIRTG